VLTGIHPLLTGRLLTYLDAMGHSDAVVVADAHFPAERLASRILELPGLTSPDVLRAIRTVVPLGDAPAFDLMTSATGAQLPVQDELIAAAGTTVAGVRFVERHAFYEMSAQAFLIIRTGETRKYGNALLRKGVVTADQTLAGTGKTS